MENFDNVVVIDTDGHVYEGNVDLRSRMPEKWRSQAPVNIKDNEGNSRILLLEQHLIDRIDPLQALLDGGEHLLLQEGDFLLPIGMLNPGAAQRLAGGELEDALHAAERGLQQQKRILLRATERGREGRGHGEVRRGRSDGTDPSGGPTQEGLMLERAGARPHRGKPQSVQQPTPDNLSRLGGRTAHPTCCR